MWIEVGTIVWFKDEGVVKHGKVNAIFVVCDHVYFDVEGVQDLIGLEDIDEIG